MQISVLFENTFFVHFLHLKSGSKICFPVDNILRIFSLRVMDIIKTTELKSNFITIKTTELKSNFKILMFCVE